MRSLYLLLGLLTSHLSLVAAKISVNINIPGHVNTFKNQTLVRSLNKYILQQLDQNLQPGGAMSLYAPGQGRLVETFGVDNHKTQHEFQTKDHFRMASITKTYVATAVLQLVDQKKISLDAPLSDYLTTSIPYRKQITIRQLLSMTSGIYDYTSDTQFLAAFKNNPHLPFSFQKVLQIVGKHKPLFKPGKTTMASYCDTNYYILGEIVEKVTGCSVGKYITEHIIKPLHLSATSYPTTSKIPSPASKGYYIDVNSTKLMDYSLVNPAVPAGAGAMITDINDLRKWAKALGTGATLSKKLTKLRLHSDFSPIYTSPALNVTYGLGLLTLNQYYGHNGAIYGFNSFAFYNPNNGYEFAFVGNQGGNFGPLELGLAATILGMVDPTFYDH